MDKTNYSVQELANLSGLSVRTLHYYDQIGLLPVRRKHNNYRSYGRNEVDRLHQILLYKEYGMELDAIKQVLDQDQFDAHQALKDHLEKLKAQQKRLELVVTGVEKALACEEKGEKMKDEERFEAYKKKLVEENEEKYGKEIREKYGDEQVDASNANLMGMNEKEYQHMQDVSAQMMVHLLSAAKEGDPASEEAQKACDLHRQMLELTWKKGTYNKQAHKSLGEMFVADERFKSYYDKEQPGTAEFLRDALNIYCAE